MKAIVYTKYGPPDVLQLQEVAKPTPKDNEVFDQNLRGLRQSTGLAYYAAEPFLARLGSGLLKPKNTRLGADVAGRVEAVGSNGTHFQPGDEVFGEVSLSGLGSFAEYVCASEDLLALKPANISFQAAAAVAVAAFTALQGLRDKGQLRPGQKVLINGASGGVGTFAVQIAKALGAAEVTGVCSTRNLEMVRSIGADHVIDYTQEDFTQNGQRYDLIFDAVGNRSVADYQRALNPNGICSIAGFTTIARLFEHMLLGAWVSRRGSKKIGLMGTAKANKQDLLVIKELLESGKVTPVIDRTYALAETAEAIRYLETGRARGKVVITVVS